MINTRGILMGALLLGCSAAGGEDDAITCSAADRTGTYLTNFETLSGDCGDIPAQVGRIDNAVADIAPCVFDEADRWTEGDCKLERAYTCPTPEVEPGARTRYVAVSTQETDDGGRIVGTVTMQGLLADGTAACVG